METQTLPYCGIHNVAMGPIKSDMSHFQSLCGGKRQDCRTELAVHGKQYYSKDDIMEDSRSRF